MKGVIMTFSITRLANSEALITGTDRFGTDGKTVVSTRRYDEVRRELAMLEAKEAFDEKIEDFFSELTEAADELRKTQVAVPVEDPASFVVVDAGIEGTPGKQGITLRFDPDGTVLNLIENGDSGRLVWMGDKLLITEYVPPATADEDEGMAAATALVEEELGGTEVSAREEAVEDADNGDNLG